MKPKTFQIRGAVTVALGLIALSSLALPSVTFAKDFSNRSVKGGYSIFLNGWITRESSVNYPAGLIPTWSVGVFRADGNGKLQNAEVTLNVGGACIVQLTGSGEYNVKENGTGSASAKLSLQDQSPPNCWAVVGGGDSVKFDLNFAINNETLEFVGTSFENLTSNAPVSSFRFGSSGQARPQTTQHGRF